MLGPVCWLDENYSAVGRRRRRSDFRFPFYAIKVAMISLPGHGKYWYKVELTSGWMHSASTCSSQSNLLLRRPVLGNGKQLFSTGTISRIPYLKESLQTIEGGSLFLKLTKSRRKRRSICFMASRRKPVAPVVYTEFRKDINAWQKERTLSTQFPHVKRSLRTSGCRWSICSELQHLSIQPGNVRFRSDINTEEVVIISEFSVDMLWPALVVLAYKPIYTVGLGFTIPINS